MNDNVTTIFCEKHTSATFRYRFEQFYIKNNAKNKKLKKNVEAMPMINFENRSLYK